MPTYTIRPGFTIAIGELIYSGGESVELNEIQFELNKHKLEGVEPNQLPKNLGSGLNTESIEIDTYRSPELNYINGAELVFAHGWDSFDPTTDWYQVQAWAVCTQNQNGWVVGERALLSRRATVSVDADNIYLQIGNNGISITRKDGGNEFSLNSNNWLVFVKGISQKN